MIQNTNEVCKYVNIGNIIFRLSTKVVQLKLLNTKLFYAQ